jgi:hypothetical protein
LKPVRFIARGESEISNSVDSTGAMTVTCPNRDDDRNETRVVNLKLRCANATKKTRSPVLAALFTPIARLILFASRNFQLRWQNGQKPNPAVAIPWPLPSGECAGLTFLPVARFSVIFSSRPELVNQ